MAAAIARTQTPTGTNVPAILPGEDQYPDPLLSLWFFVDNKFSASAELEAEPAVVIELVVAIVFVISK